MLLSQQRRQMMGGMPGRMGMGGGFMRGNSPFMNMMMMNEFMN